MIHNFVRIRVIKILLISLLCTSVANNNFAFYDLFEKIKSIFTPKPKKQEISTSQKIGIILYLLAIGGLFCWLYKKGYLSENGGYDPNNPPYKGPTMKTIFKTYPHTFDCFIEGRAGLFNKMIEARTSLQIPINGRNQKINILIVKNPKTKCFFLETQTLPQELRKIIHKRNGINPGRLFTSIYIDPKNPKIKGLPRSHHLKAIICAINENETELLKIHPTEIFNPNKLILNVKFGRYILSMTEGKYNDFISNQKKRKDRIVNQILEKEPFKIQMHDNQKLLANKIFLYN